MKTLVVYYSLEGNTEYVAEKIREALGADLLKLVPKKAYHDKGFEVIGVSFDQKKAAWVKAIGQLKMPWLQISDLKGWECAAAPIYKIDGIPDNILIDPQGKIIDRGLRGKPLHKRLEQLLNK